MGWTMFSYQKFRAPEPPDPPPPPPPARYNQGGRIGIHAVAKMLDSMEPKFERAPAKPQACGWQCKGCKATHGPDVFRCIWCRTYRTEDSPSLHKQGGANKLPSQIQAEMYAKQAEINAAWVNSMMGNKK